METFAVAELPVRFALPANVAVAVQLVPTFVQSPAYVTIAVPDGITFPVAVNGEPV